MKKPFYVAMILAPFEKLLSDDVTEVVSIFRRNPPQNGHLFFERCLLVLGWLLVAPLAHATNDPLDWTYCLGPRYDRTSFETGLIDDFKPEGGPGSNVLWKRSDLDIRSTPIVMDGRLYTILRADPGTPIEGERVVCLDAATGDTIWEQKFNVFLSDVPAERVGWSSVVGDPETGNVYALGVCGLFQCFDGKTGSIIWSIPLHERFGLLSTYGGRTNFPIVCEDLVIISAIVIGWGDMAKPAHRFIGFDKETGDVVWFNGTRPLPYDTTYSAPSLAVIDGQKVLVFGSGDGSIWGIQPRTGEHLWHFPISRRGVNAPPLVVGDKVYAMQNEENVTGTKMGCVAALNVSGATGDITEYGKLWLVPEVVSRLQPLMVDENLWLFDDRAKLHILDPANGKPRTKRIALGRAMRSTPLVADGKVYAFSLSGRWSIYEPDAKLGAKSINEGTLPRGESVFGSPICSHGRIYLPTTGGLYCLADSSQPTGSRPAPAPPQESPVEADSKPAHLQVIPADVLMKPGESKQFTARVFNSKGQLLKTVKAKFAVDGNGSVTDAGTFTAGTDGHVAAYVTATAEGLTGQARVRIVPSLPWHFDFEDTPISQTDPRGNLIGEPPVTWVGARYRHVVREVDGSKVMVKISTIPKGTRSRSWMGHSDMHDYTIQADVRGSVVDGKMPDIGVIAQGYALDMQGANQQLQIRTWVTQRRMAQAIDFPWEPNQWYTMKLRATTEGDKAVLKGKVWPRGTAEPDQWSVAAEDDSPNYSGSPGLFGNAKDAELMLDNIHITAN